MSKTDESKIVNDAKSIADWFSVSVEIRVLGKVIWSYVWPPKK